MCQSTVSGFSQKFTNVHKMLLADLMLKHPHLPKSIYSCIDVAINCQKRGNNIHKFAPRFSFHPLSFQDSQLEPLSLTTRKWSSDLTATDSGFPSTIIFLNLHSLVMCCAYLWLRFLHLWGLQSAANSSTGRLQPLVQDNWGFAWPLKTTKKNTQRQWCVQCYRLQFNEKKINSWGFNKSENLCVIS